MQHTDKAPTLHLLPVFKADYLELNLDSDKKYLEAKWVKVVTSIEFRSGIEAIIMQITANAVELLLLDLRATGTPSISDQNWVAKRLMSLNNQTSLRRSARVYSEDILQHVVGEVITARVETLVYDVQAFSCEALAREWLLTNKTATQ